VFTTEITENTENVNVSHFSGLGNRHSGRDRTVVDVAVLPGGGSGDHGSVDERAVGRSLDARAAPGRARLQDQSGRGRRGMRRLRPTHRVFLQIRSRSVNRIHSARIAPEPGRVVRQNRRARS
jgi:hypothetical protein